MTIFLDNSMDYLSGLKGIVKFSACAILFVAHGKALAQPWVC
jgi:hypothetical protein